MLSDQQLAPSLTNKLNQHFDCDFLSFSSENINCLGRSEKLILIRLQKTSLKLKKYLYFLLTSQLDNPIILFINKTSSTERVQFFKMGIRECFSGKICNDELVLKLASFYEEITNKKHVKNYFYYQDFHFCFKSKTSFYQEKKLKLNKKETQILSCLIQRKNTLVTREQIYTEAWSTELRPNSNSLEAYICRLRKKLTKICGFNPIKTICGVGYKLLTPTKSPQVNEGFNLIT
ncbi:MAG: winged helix-turn-helix domain-containing protein [Candidatus Pacebacteria bacterium]|nr:winged helix-turn-helix domain-containing protein [Candidatus Paceibacterota bacterium]